MSTEQNNMSIATQDLSIVSRHKGVFTEPPVVTPTRKTPDGPLLGNGDLGVAISGVIERRRFYGLDSHASNTMTEILYLCTAFQGLFVSEMNHHQQHLPDNFLLPVHTLTVNFPLYIQHCGKKPGLCWYHI